MVLSCGTVVQVVVLNGGTGTEWWGVKLKSFSTSPSDWVRYSTLGVLPSVAGPGTQTLEYFPVWLGQVLNPLSTSLRGRAWYPTLGVLP